MQAVFSVGEPLLTGSRARQKIKTVPSGPGPTAGFISLISLKETNQRKGSPAGGFYVQLSLLLANVV